MVNVGAGFSGNLLKLSVNSTQKFAINASGDVTTTSGLFTSQVADSGSAIGFKLITPSYTTSGAKLFSVFNDTDEKFSLDKDGVGTFYGSGGSLIDNTSGDITIDAAGGNISFAGDNLINVGRVGIGRSNPSVELDVAGDTTISGALSLAPQVQAYAGTCNASRAGKMYYDASQNKYYFCNGTSWGQLGSGAGGTIDGSGTTNYLVKWLDTDTLTDSILYEIGGNVGIGTTNPTSAFNVGASNQLGIDSSGNLSTSGTLTATTTNTLNGLSINSGIITAGTWNGSAIAVQYGGTGQNWSGVLQGALPYFSGTGVMNTLGVGTAGYVLQANGASANPSWVDLSSTAGPWTLVGTSLYPDLASYNVGIGFTGVPGSKLSIAGGESIGATYATLAAPANGLIVQGNTGIGTTSPSQLLNVRGGSILLENNGSDTPGVGGLKFTEEGGNSEGKWVLRPTVGSATANLFSDGFESGDLTAWNGVAQIDGGDLSAHTDAKIHGNYGLKAVIDDTNTIYVRDNTPVAEKRYRVRFYIDPNTLTMADNDSLYPFFAWDSAWQGEFDIFLERSSGVYNIAVSITKDTVAPVASARYPITDAPHWVEVDWKASSAPGADNGFITLWIDGVLKETIANVDNDTKQLDHITFGSTIREGTGTSGTLYLDDFESNNDGSPIGPVGYDLALDRFGDDNLYSPVMYFKRSNGNVGIGTTSPIHQLDVNGRINQSWNYFFTDFFGGLTDLTADTLNAWQGLRFGITTGCTGSIPAGINGFWRNATGTTSGYICTLSFNDTNQFDDTNNPIVEIPVYVNSGASHTVYVGLSDRSADTAGDPTNGVYFKFSGGGNWLAVTRATTETSTNTGIAPSTSAFQVLRIEHSTSSVNFYIDGTLKATHTSTIPTANLDLDIFNQTNTAAAKQLNIDYIKIWQDWPAPSSILASQEAPLKPLDLEAGADLAEAYPVENRSDFDYGELVNLDPERKGYVKRTSQPYDQTFIGVISESPGLVIGEGNSETVLLGLAGRVPVKIASSSAPIYAGDYLATSFESGKAMKAQKAGFVIGKALESWNLQDGKEKILVALNSTWYDPDIYLTSTGDLHIARDTQDVISNTQDEKVSLVSRITYHLFDAVGSQIKRVGAFADLIAANIQAGRVETQELVSPVAEIGEIKTQRISLAEISPATESGNIVINLGVSDQGIGTSSSEFGKLIIKGEEGKEVASIDASGNATFSGQITSDTLNVIRDTTISGTLYADEIITKHGKFGDLLVNDIAKTETPIEISDNPALEEATTSAILSEEEINNLINEILASTPEATSQATLSDNINIPSDLLVSNSLNIGGTMTLADNSLNTLSGPLYLQSLGLGGIDILAGKITIDSSGNLIVEGNVTIKGDLAANTIRPLPEKDLVIDLAQIPITNESETDLPSEAIQSAFGQLLVKGIGGQVVASIDASGSATFA